MPVSLAYLAGFLREKGHAVHVIDAFGERPENITIQGTHIIQGLTTSEVLEKISVQTQHVFVYAGQVVSHTSLLALIREIHQQHPSLPITVLENTQSVVAYALSHVADDFLNAGATYLITGEAEFRAQELLNRTPIEKIDGLIYQKGK